MKSRKELKEEYKNRKPRMGVFQIRNKQNGKIFVDGHTDVKARINRHVAELRMGSHPNKLLQKDWKLFGEEHFKFELLSEMKYENEKSTDYKKELKILRELVISEMEEGVIFY